jgi:hypothetical protein
MEDDLLPTPAQLARQGLIEMWDAIDADRIAKSKAPLRISLKQKMRMTNGSYGVGTGINAPRDPLTNVPIVGPG